MAVITPAPIKERIPGPYPADRRCAHRTRVGETEVRCITRLHRFHEGAYCHAHEAQHEAELERAA